MVRIVDFDGLPVAQESYLAATNLAAFGTYWDRRIIGFYRRHRFALAPYGALYALDDGEVVGQLLVLRLQYTTRDGPETMTGIGGVATRPDRSRRGVATALLREAHRRERAAGLRTALLWTNRSWVAHALYEQLGYADIYSPAWAVRRARTRIPLPSGWRTSVAREADLSRLEELHREATKGGVGFTPRPPRAFRLDHRAGELDPTHFTMVFRGRELRGYARHERSRRAQLCAELVGVDPDARRVAIAALERAAHGGMVGFGQTVVNWDLSYFRRSGYAIVPMAWQTLMKFVLAGGPSMRPRDLDRFATNDPRFVCMTSDRF